MALVVEPYVQNSVTHNNHAHSKTVQKLNGKDKFFWKKITELIHHIPYHDGEVYDGEPDDEDDSPLLLLLLLLLPLDSLGEVSNDFMSFSETEHAFSGRSFIGVNVGVESSIMSLSSSPEEQEEDESPVSSRDGDDSGVSKGVVGLLAASFEYIGFEM